MAYIIYKTNGQQLLTLLDGTLDSSRGVNLVGKNYVNFGTAQNENFVWLLENHANDTPPTYPLTGQLWFDTGTSTLKYFDGTSFNILSNAAGVASNVASLTSALTANVANLSSYFSSNIATLTSNAASQHSHITDLWANAAIQASLLNALTSTVTGSNVDISSLLDSTNSRIDDTNSNVSEVSDTISTQISRLDDLVDRVDSIDDLVSSQAATQISHGSYISTLQSGLTGANAAIVASNVAIRSYIDATNSTQNSQITNLSNSFNTLSASFTSFYSWANVNFGTSNYTNFDVALYLPTYGGNIAATRVTSSADLTLDADGWITMNSAPKLPSYSRSELESYTNPPTGGIAFYSNVGVPVYYDGDYWKFFSNNTAI